MRVHKFKIFFLFIIISIAVFYLIFSPKKLTTEEIETLGKEAFSFIQTFDTMDVQSIQAVMPSFDICKTSCNEKNSTAYSIEIYDQSVAKTIELIQDIQAFDSTINWKAIEFRDFSYSTYREYDVDPFSMVKLNPSARTSTANFIAGEIHFKSNNQNYKMEVYWRKVLKKWYSIRFRNLEKAFTY